MKRKYVTRVVGLLLTASMMLGLFGCGQTEPSKTESSSSKVEASSSESQTQSAEEKVAVTYPMDTDVELDVYFGSMAFRSSAYTSYEESPWHNQISEMTGITTNCIPLVQDKAAYILMVSTEEEAADLMQCNFGEVSTYAADGLLLDLTDYLPEYAPNFWAYINLPENADVKKELMNDEGRFYFIPQIGEKSEENTGGCYMGPCVRQDWLDECGLKAPVTIADWENMLVTFKEKYGATLGGPYDDFTSAGLASGFGALANSSAQLVVVDGKVVLGNALPEWRTYIETMRKWNEMGLFDADFFTGDRTVARQKAAEGKIGATFTAKSQLTALLADARETESEAKWVGVEYPRVAAGEPTSMIQAARGSFTASATFVVSSFIEEEKIPVALAWMDYFFTEEGQMFTSFGIEGETYTMVDGQPVFTELVTEDPIGITQASAKYTGNTSSMIGVYPYAKARALAGQDIAAYDAVVTWVKDSDAWDYLLPTAMSRTVDEQATYADYWGAIGTYVNENAAKFIKGEAEIDWDKFMDDLEGMGLQKVLDVNQAAYDRFLAR